MRRTPAIVVAALCALTAFDASAAAAAPVNVQRSGWFWGNPAPQGETLNAVSFQGAVGYAVGEHGTVLRSNDDGNSWTGLPSGTETGLSLVQELEPGLVVVAGGCVLRESGNGGASFVRLPVNESETSCAQKIVSFSFLNASAGYVEQANGSILYTSDGGESWSPRTAVPGGTPVQIAFFSTTVGLAVVNGPEGGRVYRTADGGGSWTQVASVAGHEPLNAITLAGAKVAYAVGGSSSGSGPVWLASEDEGQTFKQQPVKIASGFGHVVLRQLACSQPLSCIAVAFDSAQANMLLRTTDGGETGTLYTPAEQTLNAVASAAGSDVVAVGAGGTTVLSSDGGVTYPTLLSSSLTGEFSGPIRVGSAPQYAYLPGHGGRIAVTVDGGAAWSVLQVPTSENLLDVAFPTSTIGYTVNAAGTLYRTADGGTSWAILGSLGEVSSLLAPNASTVLAIGPGGVRRSVDSGASFATVGGSVVTGPRRHRVLRRAVSSFRPSAAMQLGSTVVAWGSEAAIESTDGGATWRLIDKPLARGAVEALSFVSATTGYEISRERLFFTHDAGRSWSEISSLGAVAAGLSFSSAADGYVLAPFEGRDDVLMRTSNGGLSWTPELLPRRVEDVAAAGGDDYAFGEGALFGTTDGGLDPVQSTLTLALKGPRHLSRRLLRKAGDRVTLSGRLASAQGGERVVVSFRAVGSSSWGHRTVTVASDGSFSLGIGGVSASTDFVAQWAGEAPESGAGSAAVALTVTRR